MTLTTVSASDPLNGVKDHHLTQKRYYRSPYTLFFSFYKKGFINVLVALVFLFITAAGQTLPAVLTARALTELGSRGFTDQFVIYCALIAVVSVIFVISGFISSYIFFITASGYERDIRQEFYDVIQSHSLTFHDEHNSSKLLAMGMTEIQQMRMGIFPSQRMLITSLFTISISLWFITNINPLYGALTLLGAIIYLLLAYRTAQKISPVRRNLAKEVGNLTESSQEIFRGIDVVRGLSAGEREKGRFNKRSLNYANLSRTESRFQAFYYPSLALLLLTVVIFGLAGMDVVSGKAEVGQLIEAVAILLMLQATTRMIPMAFLMVQAGLINSRRVWDVLHWADPQPDTAVTNEAHGEIDWKGDITFDGVVFTYTGDVTKAALKDISVEIPRGSKVALIGGPGSGKSTFLKLLLRLYDPQQGEIRVDNQNISELPALEVRRHVARVEQEIFLFQGTIRENIGFSNPSASDDQLIEAAKAAQAWEFIQQMPKQLDTVIGERGVTLSGGQRQRLGIARAILANPDILLLDDSVSAVDSHTEMLLRKALDNLLDNRTSFTVTQRLNTLVRADKILLFEKGQLLVHGTHEELLKCCTEYQKIFELLPESEQLLATRGGAQT